MMIDSVWKARHVAGFIFAWEAIWGISNFAFKDGL